MYGYISEKKLMSSDQKKTGTPTTTTTTTTTSSSTDATPGFQLNQKKLKELAENAQAIKIGGKVGLIYSTFH